MVILSFSNVTKSFGIDIVLKDITFTINEGDRVGIIGKNGAGKSTLFKIISGELPYDSGEIYLAKNINIGYLKQSSEDLNENNTIFEECLKVFEPLIEMEKRIRELEIEIAGTSQDDQKELNKLMSAYSALVEEFRGKNGYGYKSEIRGNLKGLGFKEDEFDKKVYALSGGEKARLNIAKLLLSKPNILLLDEPTNHLDIEAINWLEMYLKNYQGTLLIISHDRYFLNQTTKKIFEIENNTLIQYDGNYTDYMKYKKNLYNQNLKKYLEQQKEIERQEELIRRFKQHGTEKLAKRAKSREKALEKMEIIDKPVLSEDRVRIKFQTHLQSGRNVLQVEDLSKSFGDNRLFDKVSFNIYRGERVSLIGPNGVGKTTLLKMILGEEPKDTGIVEIGHNVIMGYYDQEQKNLNPDNDLIEEISDVYPKLSIPEIRNILASFLFTGDDVYKKVSTLSGGEKSRLSLLKLMLSKANFLLLDEPTNHLDLMSKEILEDALLDYDGTLLFISHDRYFLNKVATKTLELSKEGIKEYLGNYDYYREKKSELNNPVDKPKEGEKTKTRIREERRRQKIEAKEKTLLKKAIEKLEEEIGSLEKKLEELDLMMCREEIYSNPLKSKEIHDEREKVEKEIEELYNKWTEIMDNL